MKKYNYNEVYESTLKYFNGDELATKAWINKYCLKDYDNNYYEINPNDMHRRISSELARIESNYPNGLSEDDIFNLLKDFKYIIPQGSPMSGIGNNLQTVSLSNCYVVGNDADSYGGIFIVDQEQAQLMKRRGGVGHDLSHIRPKNSKVNNSALNSTGIVPFMERFSNTTREVAQDGRRGALMLSCSIKHPDSEDFIDAKLESGKITGANISVRITDDFMESVINNNPYTQKYPINSDNPIVSKDIDAKKLWDKIIHNAWRSAEPGILFWDTIIKESVPDCYADLGFNTKSTNPCVVGDTLVSTADGRNLVSIKQLADEGKDIPVYCLDNNGKLAIRIMRNPRITGYNQQIFKIKIENGHEFRVTGNHKIRLKNGNYVEAKNLKSGDSLHIMTKYQASIEEIFKRSNSRSSDYNWLNNGDFKNTISEHRFIFEQLNNLNIPKNHVIHHKDFNSLNNSLSNLSLLSKEEHDHLHGDLLKGDKNPYHKMSGEWKFNFASHKGDANSKYIKISNDEIKEHAINLTKKLNRRFSKNDWIKYAKENNLPQHFSECREYTVTNLSKLVACELKIEFIHTDPRLVKSYIDALENGYNAEIKNNTVIVEKICEYCNESFWVDYKTREISFCSHECALNHINNNIDIKEKRSNSINNTYNIKGENTKQKQLKIYKDLKFNLNREPTLKEWEIECKENDTSFRLKTKYGFNSYKEIKEESEYYNHKVISIELDGYENVYNGTVDEFHNFFIGGFQEITKSGKPKYVNINNLQCGEIPLCPYDSCRLLALNLYSYVNEPFTKQANFDYKLFEQHVIYAQRFMDDIVDLEIEKIDKILQKIESDPEDKYIKDIEKQLWIKIKDKTIKGRRTGLGITSEGDMLAAMGITYGTKEATDFSENIHKILATQAYKSSCILAKERGSFPIYDYNREINNPFVSRLKSIDNELDDMLKEGRRNIGILTAAPTGTVSLMTQTTSGIEPAFLIYYKRRRKINPNDKNSKVDFVDEVGDKWEEYVVFHHKFLIWLEINGYDVEEVKKMKDNEIESIIEKSPYYKATSNDVDWVEKVRLQGAIQKFVDHSISVTINLPENITEDMVSKVYMEGWKSGCKGITIYRDNSRSGVLVSTKKNESANDNIILENNAPKRPKTLECDVIRFTNKGEKWIGFIGLNNGMPYEIFTGLAESFVIPTWIDKGIIKKEKLKNRDDVMVSRYDFIYVDKEGYEVIMTGLNRAFNREYWNIGKMTSALLRHHIHLPSVINIIDSLKLDGDVLGTWKKGVIRMLKRYIKDEIKVTGKTCEHCGSSNLVNKEGCISCMDCGWSRC